MSATRPDIEAEVVAGGSQDDYPEQRSETGFPDATDTATIDVLKIDYTTRNRANGAQEPVLEVFGRNTDNDLEHVRVFGFEPYFYAPADEAVELGESDPRVKRVSSDTYQTIREDTVRRVYTHTPAEVGQLSNEIEDYEADIPFHNRFIIDKGIENGIEVPARRTDDGAIKVPSGEVEPVTEPIQGPSPRVMMIDIEVEDRNGFPENGEEPLISITTHDSYTDKYVVWYYDAEDGEEGPETLPDYEPIRDDVETQIVKLDSEETMVRAFLGYLDEADPSIISGWNFDDFDVPYLINRLKRLGIDPGRLSRLGYAKDNWDPDVGGRVVFDLLKGYKRTQFTEKESYRLDAVAEDELGIGKETYTGKLGDLWEDDPETLLEYNLRDVELCVEINRKQEIIPFWREVQNFIGCSLTDAPVPGDACDMYVLHMTNDEFVLPSKENSEKEDIEGGAVFEPISGVLENVAVQDLRSLYPMSMCSINASPETKIENPDEYDGETYVSPNGIHFQKDEDGVIQEMIDHLLEEREQKKALREEHAPGAEAYELFDRQQAAVKVIMNSLYGVLSWSRFRLYDKEIGAATTATGREVIKFTETCVEELGYEVAYGDTDSVMYPIPDKSGKEEIIKAAKNHAEYINNRYDDFAKQELNADDHRFELEFEKLYRRFFQAGKKKRYAGHIVWKEGNDVDKTDITGFEYERSDQSKITKRVQKKVLEMIVMGEDRDDIVDYLREVITDFRDEEIPLEDIGMPGGIGKELDNYDTATAQVRGAIYANIFLGTNFQKGSKPKRVYLRDVDSSFFDDDAELNDEDEQTYYAEFRRDPDVICYNYEEQVPDEFHVDWDKMLSKTLEGPISRVIEAIGIEWSEVTVNKSQTDFEQFM